MIVYHGTTIRNAQNIRRIGFIPREPSWKVWFAENKELALRRAKSQARRTRDLPVVLVCNINLKKIRHQLGGGVSYSNRVIAISGHVPATVVCSSSMSWAMLEPLASPEGIATWVNELLGMSPRNGVSKSHPGIYKLSFWMVKRLTSGNGEGSVRLREVFQKAYQWFPEFSKEIDIEPEDLRMHHEAKPAKVEMGLTSEEINAREEEVLDCLASTTAEQRIRGFKLLAELEHPLLFDWCMMHLNDDFKEMYLAVLHTMLVCDKVEPEALLPFASPEENNTRAAAVEALAKHSGTSPLHWFERALKHNSIDIYPEDTIAALINHLLRRKPGWGGVSPEHIGIRKLSDWMARRFISYPHSSIRIGEFLHRASKWLPEFSAILDEVREKLRAHRKADTIFSPGGRGSSLSPEKIYDREEEALDCLISEKPRRRILGLKLLAELEIPDLFDWCVMFLDDESTDVRVVALRTMLHCNEVNFDVLLPLAESEDKRIRAAVIAVLAKHSDENAPRWFERAFRDESACVRFETAALLSELDTDKHRHIFELALRDPNPRIKQTAQRLTVGKGCNKTNKGV